MAVNARFSTRTLIVWRTTRSSDGAGGWTETPTEVGEVTGSLQPQSAAEGVAADQERALARWVFFAEPAADVRRGDELVDGDRTWRVIDVGEWTPGSSIDHKHVDLEEIQHGQ